MTFLTLAVPLAWRKEPQVRARLRQIRERIKKIIAACSCRLAKLPEEGNTKHPPNMRVVEAFNSEVEVDLLKFHTDELVNTSFSNLCVLVVACKSTGYTVAEYIPGRPTAEMAARAFVLGWCRRFGPPAHVVYGDMGGEFLGQDFLKCCSKLGLIKLCGAPRVFRSHGTVEVRNRFFRQYLRKSTAELKILPPQIEMCVAVMENEFNNGGVRLDGSGVVLNPSYQVFGTSTALLRTIFTDTPGTATCQTELLDLAEACRELFQTLKLNNKLRVLMQTPVHAEFKTDYRLGDAIYYLINRSWLGPAFVAGINTVGKYVIIDHGGTLVHAHFMHVKPANISLEGNSLSGTYSHSEGNASDGKFYASPSRGVVGEAMDKGLQEMLGANSGTPPRTPVRRGGFSACPGCQGPGRAHWPSCERSQPARRAARELERAHLEAAKAEAARLLERAAAVPVPDSSDPLEDLAADVSPPAAPADANKPKPKTTKQKRNEKAAQGSARISTYFKPVNVSNIVQENIVPIQIGDSVSFFLTQMRTAQSGVVIEKCDQTGQCKIKSVDNHVFEAHVLNCRKKRKNPSIFHNTSTSNAENAVVERSKSLQEKVEEQVQRLAGKRTVNPLVRECLFTDRQSVQFPPGFVLDEGSTTGGSDDSDACSDCSHFSDCFATVVDAEPLIPTNVVPLPANIEPLKVNVNLPNSNNPIPQKKYLQEADVKNLDFNNLPPIMRERAYNASIHDFEQGECFGGRFTLKEWNRLRNKTKAKSYSGPEVVLLDSTWVAKCSLDESLDESSEFWESYGQLRGKVRLAPRGFRDKGISKREAAAPTVNPVTQRLAHAEYMRLKKRRNLIPVKIDIKRAFFQIKSLLNPEIKRVGLLLPPELQGGREGDQRLVIELRKEVPGTKLAPQVWHLDLVELLTSERAGMSRMRQSRIDPCFFFQHNENDGGIDKMFSTHVDDGILYVVEEQLPQFKLDLKRLGIETRVIKILPLNIPFDLLGCVWEEREEGTYIHQQAYIMNTLLPIKLETFSPAEKQGKIEPGSRLFNAFRERLGQSIWCEKTRSEHKLDNSLLASLCNELTIGEIHYMNDVIEDLRSTSDRKLFLPRLPDDAEPQVIGLLDAALGNRHDLSSQGAQAVGLGLAGSDHFVPLDVNSRRIRRRGSSSFDVETLKTVECTDMAILIGFLYEEIRCGVRPSLLKRIMFEIEGYKVSDAKTKILIDTDAKDVVTRVYSLKSSMDVSKRRRMDVCDCQECLAEGDITIYRHITGKTNPMDCLTKKYGKYGQSKTKASYVRFLQLLYDGKYVADLTEPSDKQMLAIRYIEQYRFPTMYGRDYSHLFREQSWF